MIYDGSDDKSMLIGEVFGTPNHKIVKSISSTGKSIFIDFKKQVPWGILEFLAFIQHNKINPDFLVIIQLQLMFGLFGDFSIFLSSQD